MVEIKDKALLSLFNIVSKNLEHQPELLALILKRALETIEIRDNVILPDIDFMLDPEKVNF